MYKSESLLIVISGPSGVGKGTIVKKLFEKQDNLALSVSATTRKMRDGELEGVNYYYKTQDEFLSLQNDDAFLETFEIFGNKYGTLKADVFQQINDGKDVILEIDVQGGIKIKKEFAKSVLIFILPPSVRELTNRLVGRNTEDACSLKLRTEGAIDEIKKCKFYDYVVLNASIDGAVCDIMSIIESEKSKISRNFEYISELLGGNLV